MRQVFVDTVYWLALMLRDDPWTERAANIEATLRTCRLTTREEVLAEFLTGVSRAGKETRKAAVRMVRAILADPHVTVPQQSHDSFAGGLSLFEKRGDKHYSMVAAFR